MTVDEIYSKTVTYPIYDGLSPAEIAEAFERKIRKEREIQWQRMEEELSFENSFENQSEYPAQDDCE